MVDVIKLIEAAIGSSGKIRVRAAKCKLFRSFKGSINIPYQAYRGLVFLLFEVIALVAYLRSHRKAIPNERACKGKADVL